MMEEQATSTRRTPNLPKGMDPVVEMSGPVPKTEKQKAILKAKKKIYDRKRRTK
jgi:hypothetical protein